MAEAAAKAAAARVAGGESLADASREFGLQPAGVTTVMRTSDGLPPALLKAAFTAPHPAAGKASAGTAVLANGDVALFVVSAVRSGSMDSPETAARFAESMQSMQRQAAAAEFAAYVKELERTAKVQRNEKVFE